MFATARRHFAAALVALVLPFAPSLPAAADLGVSPLVVELSGDRGSTDSTLNVFNTSNKPIRARISIKPFTYDRNEGFKVLGESKEDLSPYVRFSPREMVIPAGGSRRVRVLVQLPANLSEGERRAVIFAETLIEATDANGYRVDLITQIGSTIYVRRGNIAPQLAATTASFDGRQLVLNVRNSGRASVRPAVKWTLKKGDAAVATGNLDPFGVIAESDRNIGLPLPAETKNLAAGDYQLSGELVYGEEEKPTKVPFTVALAISRPLKTVTAK